MTSQPRTQLVAAVAVLAIAIAAFGGENRTAPSVRRLIAPLAPTGPTLVGSGKAFFLHALPHGPTALRPRPRAMGYREREHVGHGGVTLLHTARPGGKMTVLVRTDGYTWTNNMTEIVTGGTHVTRILGLIWDKGEHNDAGKGAGKATPKAGEARKAIKPNRPIKKYLYALIRSSSTSVRGATRTSTTVTLTVWDLRTGVRIASGPLPPAELANLESPPPRAGIRVPHPPAPDVLTAGPLKLTQAGLTCGKTLFTVKDGKLIAKPLTPPK